MAKLGVSLGYQNSETMNRLSQNLAWVIMSAMSLLTRMPKFKAIDPMER